MKRKYKMTGCARFFLAILIIAPLAYIGASYYNGEDPIRNIREFFSGTTGGGDTKNDTYTGTDEDLSQELKAKDRQINDLEKRIEALEEDLASKDKEIKHLQQQLDAIQNPE